MVWTIDSEAVIYCPVYGDRLGSRRRDHGTARYCSTRDLTLYRNPEPMDRATVVGEESLLLVEMVAGVDSGEWALPGGHPEYDESLRAGAARELPEETGLSVDPEVLTLIGDGFLDFGDGRTMVSVNYATPASAASGTVEAGDDAAAARFWSRAEIASDPPLVRASGRDQLLDAIDRFGATD
jgi:ADP-ribose pyrophosphatase YjhB (NUDIX family)